MGNAPIARLIRATPRLSRVTPRLAAIAISVAMVMQFSGPTAAVSARSVRAAAGRPVVSYAYDADGRLSTVTDAAGQRAVYHYDATGNVTSVARTTAAAQQGAVTNTRRRGGTVPVVVSVRPSAVRVGQFVTVSGAGFSRDRAADVVRIGALMAQVASASPARLVVVAPPGIGGAVTVRTPAGSSTKGAVRISGGPRPLAAGVAVSSSVPRSLHARAGETALAGQIDTVSGKPLAGVEVTAGGSWAQTGATARTDQRGRFLLSGLTPGQHVLTIDAASLAGGRDYGVYSEPVELPRGRTTALPWVTYLTPIDTAHSVRIDSPTKRAVTVTTPLIPGLKILIPKGTVIRDRYGKVVRSLSVTPLPTDRTPMPWGPSMVPRYFTVQPGDATVSGPGLKVIYPNSTRRPAGEAVSYLAENPNWPGTGWYRYGGGHVSANGRQVIPDARVRYKTTDPGGFSTLGSPNGGPPPGGQCQCGDPVDLATGLFVNQATDISLPDIEGVTLTRTFRQNDDIVRDFGIGGSDSLDVYIVADNAGNFDLVLPDGGKVVYQPTSTSGIFQAINTPTEYAGSMLTESTSDPFGPFTLSLRNGTQMAFGNPAFLTALTDRFGNTVQINRTEFTNASNGGGQIQTVTTPSGRWLAFTYGPCVTGMTTECVIKISDNAGRTVRYRYDPFGHLTGVTDVNGGITRYGWAACATPLLCTELTSITDPLGRVTKIAYDPTTGLVTRQTQPNGGVWKYRYSTSSSGVITRTVVTDPTGARSSTGIGANGYTTSNTAGFGTSAAQTTTATYDPGTGLLKSTTDPLGRTTAYTYDALGNPLTITALAGTAQAATTRYTYDPVYSRLTSVTDPLGHKTVVSYNDSARIETITNPAGKQTIITFNDHGQAISTQDPLGGKTYYSYLGGDLVATADPLGNVAATYYDAIGRPLEVADPDGHVTTYTDNPAGEELTSTDPLGAKTAFRYDADGEVTSVTDARGDKTTYAYDPLGDLRTETNPLGKTTKLAYDADGRITSKTDAVGNVTEYAYDSLGRLVTTDFGVRGARHYESVTTSFDQANQPTKIVDSRTGTYTYSYDSRGDVLHYTSPQGSISYTYNLAGRRTSMTVAGQPATTYTYDANGHLTRLTHGSARVSYRYNANGELAATTLPNGITRTNTYDAADELVFAKDATSTRTVGSARYTYDADGRITTANGSLVRASLPAAVSSARYDAGDELTAINGTGKLSYDADGNLTSQGSHRYAWNPVGELSSVRTAAATYRYTYDPAGQRITQSAGGKTTSSLYDGNVLVRQSARGTPAANYLSTGPGGTVQVQNAAGTAAPLVNGIGSTTSLTGTNGRVTTTYTYDPAGVTKISGAANSNPERFAGSQADPTGLDLMGARYYDPALGRFISQDPLGLRAGSVNPYEYAGDDPVNLTDPTGLCGTTCQVVSDVGAGFLNGLTLGLFNIQPPYCGPGLGFAYGAGNVLGALGLAALLGGALAGAAAISEAAEAAEAAEVAADLAAEESDAAAISAEGAGEEAAAEDGAASCGGLSFAANTKVLLASGSAVPISRIRPGDKVLATNVTTGKTQPEPVTAVLVHYDTNLYDLAVGSGSRVAVVRTTTTHLFWDQTARHWDRAASLHRGDRLLTAHGTTAIARGGGSPGARGGWMWDLSVARDHDFYVEASRTTNVLAHNCGGYDLFHGTDAESAQSIVNNGIDQQAASQYGGGDTFWTTTDSGQARIFAEVNPAEGDPAVVGISIEGGVDNAVATGVISPVEGLPGAYTVNNWAAFNRIATFGLVP